MSRIAVLWNPKVLLCAILYTLPPNHVLYTQSLPIILRIPMAILDFKWEVVDVHVHVNMHVHVHVHVC